MTRYRFASLVLLIAAGSAHAQLAGPFIGGQVGYFMFNTAGVHNENYSQDNVLLSATSTVGLTPTPAISSNAAAAAPDPSSLGYNIQAGALATAHLSYFVAVRGPATSTPVPIIYQTFETVSGSGSIAPGLTPGTVIITGTADSECDLKVTSNVNPQGILYDDKLVVNVGGLGGTRTDNFQEFTTIYANVDNSQTPGDRGSINVIMDTKANPTALGSYYPAGSGNSAAFAFVDPYFYVDPTFPNASAYSLVFSPGIGNAPVPEPTCPLFAGLLGFGVVALRRRRRQGL